MIIITGVSGGIGSYLFYKFNKDLIFTYGFYNKFRPEYYNKPNFFQIDISNIYVIKKWVKENEDKLNNIVLINCAGINYNSFAHKTDIAEWYNIIDVNVKGTFNIIHALLPFMRKQQYGRIINFSSVVAQSGAPGTTAYASSKSALWGMTKSLVKENASKGITINTLNLGYFNTGMIKEIPNNVLTQIKQNIPSKSLGNPINIYIIIKALIEADYINGANIDINGGLF